MKKLVIFDLDGTLLNTIDDLGQAANHALLKNDFPTHSIASYPFFVGNGVRKLMERVLPENSRSAQMVETLLADFKTYYNAHLADYTTPYPGIVELLEDLRDRGVKLAVASNKYHEAVQRLIAQAFPNIPFAAIEGQKEGVKVKPDPSVVFSVLAQAHVEKADTLYVGDSGVDMETARRACVDSVGVSWGFRPVKELNEYHANAIVSSPAEIIPIVENGIPIE